ncbi:autotransporter outer membrane beta-barrel domain-containing protein [Klebsiella sp. BIGb0407]|uniref:autotransporter outer membrane beta-barrel domain-containing protein n=1 Tax=Klebsiella sp. BIGb0407 TaxID=2940603 RepID=UPI00286E0200|nr:autotransporter outer membrane beta-barrel domain-containing protein [Klebsiella sp. BIGb0407]MCS3434089.1 outer membrane autotransporter protein [Klebsiella sp. BIGb0407]
MNLRKLLKKNKLSTSLLSLLVLIVMNTHAQPKNHYYNTTKTGSYILPNSNTTSSNGNISADGWRRSSESGDDSDTSPFNINPSNQLDSAIPIHQRRKNLVAFLNERYDSQESFPGSHHTNHKLSSTAERHTSGEKSNLKGAPGNPPKSLDSFGENSAFLVDLMKGNKSGSTPKRPSSSDEKSDLNDSLRNNPAHSASFKNARDVFSKKLNSKSVLFLPRQLPAPSAPPVLPLPLTSLAPPPPPMPSAPPVLPLPLTSLAPPPPPMPSAPPVQPLPLTSLAPPPPPMPSAPPAPGTELDLKNIYQELSCTAKNPVSFDESSNSTNNQSNTTENAEYHGTNNRGKAGVTENHIGNNGIINFSPTVVNHNITLNKLIINGNSYGSTNVSVNNIGGRNNAYLNGLELIRVDGLSEGVFNQSGRIVAGAYDYSLVRGHGNNRGSWYLTNQQRPIINSNSRIERPEAASYIANLSASNTLFNTTLSDRSGETQFTDIRTGENKITSLWLRQVGNHNNWLDSNNQLKTQSKSYVTQLGGDVMKWSGNGHRRGRLGLMAGYGINSSNSISSITNYHSKGSVKGYSVGSYATWFTNNTDKSGLYVDSWIQYNWLNNYVQGQGLPKENYKSKGITAAIEAGYTIKVGEFTKNQGMVEKWFIQPQAQITKMGVKAKKHKEANGTHVITGGEGNIQTRLGIRTYLKGQHAMDKGKNREFEPFIEANWLHNTRNFNTTLDGDRISQAGARNIGEVKIGVAGKINSKVNIWGNIGTQVADKGYSNTSVTVGVRYNF